MGSGSGYLGTAGLTKEIAMMPGHYRVFGRVVRGLIAATLIVGFHLQLGRGAADEQKTGEPKAGAPAPISTSTATEQPRLS